MSGLPRIITIAFHIEETEDEARVAFHVEGKPTREEVAAMALGLVDALADRLGTDRHEVLELLMAAPTGECECEPEGSEG